MPAEMNANDWGDMMDEDESFLPEPVTTIKDGVKTVVEYRINDKSEKKEKVTRTYKISTRIDRVNQAMLDRRNWKKFGDCVDDPPGLNPISVNVQDEEVFLILTSRAETLDDEAQPAKKQAPRQSITCSLCKGPHFTRQCPDREMFTKPEAAQSDRPGTKPGVYVPRAMKEAQERGGGGGRDRDRRSNDGMTVRVSNLPEETRETDLQDLFGKFGNILRLSLARDRATQQFKGYAHIGYSRRADAERAIEALHGHGYGHLVIEVGWPRERT